MFTPQVLAGGVFDVTIDWMCSAQATSVKEGVPLVNIAEVINLDSLMLTCLKDNGIHSPSDFHGK